MNIRVGGRVSWISFWGGWRGGGWGRCVRSYYLRGVTVGGRVVVGGMGVRDTRRRKEGRIRDTKGANLTGTARKRDLRSNDRRAWRLGENSVFFPLSPPPCPRQMGVAAQSQRSRCGVSAMTIAGRAELGSLALPGLGGLKV